MDLTWLPAWRIRELIGAREVSPVEVTEHFLGRAEELDAVLKCYRVLDAAGARQQARRAEAAVLAGNDLGPLHGVPVAVKEELSVRGLPRMAVSIGPSEGAGGIVEMASRDAPVVRRLRVAGATIFGTTIMPGMGTHSLLDAGHRATTDLAFHSRNPWNLGHVPGSSSAGSCAAVAGGVLPIAIGSDGGGSTRLPAAWSGLLGLHPTLGRVPMGRPPAGTWNVSQGPLTRNARDSATVLQAIAGPAGGELFSLQQDAPDYLAAIDAGVEGMRLAWSDDYGFTRSYAGPESERVIETVRASAERFAGLGATLERIDASFPDWSPMMALLQGAAAGDAAWATAIDLRESWWDGFRRIFQDHDLLLTPTIQHVAFTVERWNESWTQHMGEFISQWCAHTFPHNFLGWPALAVPCGFVDGLPVSLQITGRPDSEDIIFRAGHAFLDAFPFDRRPPAVC